MKRSPIWILALLLMLEAICKTSAAGEVHEITSWVSKENNAIDWSTMKFLRDFQPSHDIEDHYVCHVGCLHLSLSRVAGSKIKLVNKGDTSFQYAVQDMLTKRWIWEETIAPDDVHIFATTHVQFYLINHPYY
ncbi:hypothetical protein PGT21_007032 [Puccinia graminis f. sp. tritici]|uniref:Uncharacterized protein n=2 Tax=Puccinia graminis f. sp. tritici TaxID=56615 RepID=E3L0I1_PUCGT|nr:uncharacterized protein PGTG_15927 [Puccinia graminis f. sp. tritici CRL 75-36-700-3]EFP90079.2 hypothetical protein PGTG_15927 [Puccinia graminis f. sp. tritici CRL 75-36-700-3]KAA1112705.1 hypothetical protein PGT21_007032 [Puccinia graminis f. sp. tritici]